MAPDSLQERDSDARRALVGWCVGLLSFGFVVAWHERWLLLEWLAEPVFRPLQNLPRRPTTFDPIPELFSFYVYAATAVGLLVALPSLARLVGAVVPVKPPIRAKLAKRSFAAASYLAVILGLFLARALVLPWLVLRTLVPDSTGAFVTSFVNGYLPMAVTATIGLVLLLEFCVVIATLSLPSRRSHDFGLPQTPPSRSLGRRR